MRITDVRTTKRGRVALYVEGEFLLSMHPDVFAVSGLSVGSEVDTESLETLSAEAELKKAKEKALNLLSYKEYTTKQLTDRLKRHTDEESAEQAVARMEELGLLDDLDYGRRLAADLLNLRGYSLGRVRQTLYQRRLDKETIDQVMGELSEIDQIAPIVALVNKKYLQKLREPRGREKVAAALQRRGYRYDEIREALSQVTEGLFDEGYEEEGEG